MRILRKLPSRGVSLAQVINLDGKKVSLQFCREPGHIH